MDNKIYDVVILGGGPAGLAAGLYAGRSRLSVLILEKGIDGGQIAVTPIRGDFNDKGGNGLAGQLAGGHGLPQGGEDGLPQLFVCLRDDSRHLVFSPSPAFSAREARKPPPPAGGTVGLF